MKTELFFTVKEDGSIVNPQRLKDVFHLRSGKYILTLEKARKKRSDSLNRYYWAVIITVQQQGFKEIGYDYSKEQIHEFNKSEFNYEEFVNHETGEVKKMPRSTTDLTNVEFMEFLERIKRFGAEWLGVMIPDPNQERVTKIFKDGTALTY